MRTDEPRPADDPPLPRRQVELRARCLPAAGRLAVFDDAEIEGTIVRRFESQVRRHGDRIAVKRESGAVTYRELNRRVNRIADGILARVGGHPGTVLLLHSRPAEAIESLLAVLKAGGTVVPLDERLPVARLRRIADDSGARVLVAAPGEATTAPEVIGAGVAVLDSADLMGAGSDADPEVESSPDDLAWVVYTSGSTGAPKGVMQSHRNVLQHVASYTRSFGIGPSDRVSNLFSLATHAGQFNLFLPLLDGAAVLPMDLRERGPAELARWLPESRVTVSCMVPTVFRVFARELLAGGGGRQDGTPPRLDALRLVFLAGEPVLRADFELYRRALPRDCLFVNRLGSTETDCVRLFFADHETRIDGPTVPVGYAVADKRVVLVDEDRRPVEAGRVGEIAVESRYISPGYWNAPELTAAAYAGEGPERRYFTGDLGRMGSDGCLVSLGRRDHQVKIRGYRVEPAEIEEALLDLPGISNAVVTATPAPAGELRLVAYLVAAGDAEISPKILRSALAERLPAYMVPSAFVPLAELPRTPNGKVDRRRLPPPDLASAAPEADYRAPETPTERALVGIWQDVLGVERVGIDDEFLDHGGTSLSALRILNRVRAAFEVELDPGRVLACPTVAALAHLIESAG